MIEKKLWFVFTRCSLQQCKKRRSKETHIRKQKIQRKEREKERKRGKKMNNDAPVIGRRVVVSDAKTTGRRRKKKKGGRVRQYPSAPCCPSPFFILLQGGKTRPFSRRELGLQL